MSDYILTLDQSSGRVHKRHASAHGYQGLEGCNQDASGAYQEITQDELDAMPFDVRCRNCMPVVTEADQGAFPEPGDEDDGSAHGEVEP